jgi:hypothetical protein
MGSIWDIGTKYWYVLPQGFESRICTLIIPTSSTIGTVTKVVGKSSSGVTSLPTIPVADIP